MQDFTSNDLIRVAQSLDRIADSIEKDAGLMSIRVSFDATIGGRKQTVVNKSFNLPMRVGGFVRKTKEKFGIQDSDDFEVETKVGAVDVVPILELLLRTVAGGLTLVDLFEKAFRRMPFFFKFTIRGNKGQYKGEEVDFDITYQIIDAPFSKLPNIFRNLSLSSRQFEKIAEAILPHLEKAMYSKGKLDIKEKLTPQHIEDYLRGKKVI